MKKYIIIMMILLTAGLLGEETHDRASQRENHEGHDEDIVKLTDTELKEFDIQLDTVKGGEINIEKRVTGEVIFNQNNVTHITPLISGKVKKVYKNLGDKVKKGENIALIESKELAQLKSQYLSIKERRKLIKSTFEREERLWKKRITSEKSYLLAKNNLSEIEIQLSMFKNKLFAVGLSNYQINNIKSGKSLGNYIIKAPIEGTITQKHISIGEYIKDETDIFTVADLSTVWVNITLYQNDLTLIKIGQIIRIRNSNNNEIIEGKIDYLTPFIDEKTRTATARVIIDNENEKWFPGMFIVGYVKVKSLHAEIIVDKRAIQKFEGNTVVFTKDEDGIEPTVITLGKSDSKNIQILSGLKKGMIYVKKNSFSIKSELQKGSFGEGHSH